MFADRILDAVDAKQSALVVGIDPSLDRLPRPILEAAEAAGGNRHEIAGRALARFGIDLLQATAPYAAAIKPQLAYFERHGSYGIRAFEEIVREARQCGLLVIADGKRNDIGSTAEAYADAYLGADGPLSVDALTINAYLGSDGVEPFLKQCREHGRGVFVLVKTSNPSSGQFQDLVVDDEPVYCRVGRAVEAWGQPIGRRGFGSAGAVVGATYPSQLDELRRLMPHALFLVPGYGAQGGTADDVVPAFASESGYGALINSSRGIMYAYETDAQASSHTEAQLRAAQAARDAINEALDRAGRLPEAFGKRR